MNFFVLRTFWGGTSEKKHLYNPIPISSIETIVEAFETTTFLKEPVMLKIRAVINVEDV